MLDTSPSILYDKVVTNNKSFPLKILGFGLAEIIGLLTVFAIILGVLNYFNILSLSQIYPNLFGFLPHQPAKESSQIPTAPKVTFTCPVEKEFCDKGKEVYDGNEFLGIGYNLPIGTKIYAAISGNIVFGGAEDKERKVLSHSRIVIGGTGDTQGYSIRYEYFGLPTNEGLKQITKGSELGAVWGGNFPKDSIFNGINVLVKITSFTGQDIHVSKFE